MSCTLTELYVPDQTPSSHPNFILPCTLVACHKNNKPVLEAKPEMVWNPEQMNSLLVRCLCWVSGNCQMCIYIFPSPDVCWQSERQIYCKANHKAIKSHVCTIKSITCLFMEKQRGFTGFVCVDYSQNKSQRTCFLQQEPLTASSVNIKCVFGSSVLRKIMAHCVSQNITCVVLYVAHIWKCWITV